MGILTWVKRIGFFFVTNFLIIITIGFILRITGLDIYLQDMVGGGYQGMFIMCLLWGMIGSFISLWMSKWSAKRSFKLQMLDETDPHNGELVRRVHNLARAAGLSGMPEVGIYESPELNAFATGPTKNNSLVAVSTGLLQGMSRDEVEGVLAHEVSHISNGDMVTMTLIQGVMNAFIFFLSQLITQVLTSAMRGDGERRGGFGMGGGYFMYYIVQSVLGFLAMFVVSYFSRWREFRADAGGARLAGRSSMISALKALQQRFEPDPRYKNELPTMKISGLGGLMSTHPPLAKRIEALEAGAI